MPSARPLFASPTSGGRVISMEPRDGPGWGMFPWPVLVIVAALILLMLALIFAPLLPRR